MLRILFCNHTLDPRAGGGERVLDDLLGALDRDRFEVHLAVPRERNLADPVGVGVADAVHRLPAVDFDTRNRGALFGVAWNLLRAVVALAMLILRVRPDVLYVNSIFALHFAGPAALLTRTRFIYHEHNLLSQRSRTLWRHAFFPLARRAARIVAITDAVREELLGAGYSPDHVTTVYNGIGPMPDVNPADPSNPPSLEAGGFVVGQLANLHAWKGQTTAIRAIAELRAESLDLRLLLIGGEPDPAYSKLLRELAEELEVTDRVEFAGYRSDAVSLLPRLSCLLVASRSEPFGLALLEGMRAGIPVVGSAAGGVLEIVTDEEDGLLFSSEDSHALAVQLRRLLEDPELGQRLVRRGHQTVAGRFSVSAQARGVEQVIDAALGYPREG
ncbi:MAG: glycosyltransferase family 4 protein [bacterium]|nr:glycosyltransferase family 4 protein [bacterium]